MKLLKNLKNFQTEYFDYKNLFPLSRHCEFLPSRHCEERSDEAISYSSPSLRTEGLASVLA